MALVRAALVAWVFCLGSAARAQQQPVDFDREIRPLLAKNCFVCHGPDEEDRQAELRLDVREGLFSQRDEGVTVLPGKPQASLLFNRLTADADQRMPPMDSGRELDADQIELVRRWIEQGAAFRRHWAFEPPVRPALPEVVDSQWPLQPIDRFVLARMKREGLAPNQPADRYALIRRVYLDLIGLPPSPEQADAFVRDTRPDAYERVVDALLASPRFGERWARVWLDLARYADTQGYEKDLHRSIWPYRDWVINALNDNMPYDQFTIEQLAGDLLDDPGQDQLVATGFHRNTMTNTEGGVDKEEFRVAAVKDRISTTMQVWMGLSFRCAECHNHKYDPITQREYYAFFALFNQTEDAQDFTDSPALSIESPHGSRSNGKARTLVMRELAPEEQRETHVMVRGNFLDPGEKVLPSVPEALGTLAEEGPVNRLGVARWLVSADNPLTARVAVNRYWARLFGVGIVETEEDFGSQGTGPSHPQLLDWLATEYVRLGWDTKALLKAIVTSATYRQSSDVASMESLAGDPQNRLLSRGPRFRLEAEMVRDQALAAAGLLSSRMFGPSVMPPQPDGIWKVIYSFNDWETSQGEDRYRRGLYTYLRRTSPYPSMILFDATSREVCASRRIRTNTPLQALVTLNDDVYVEAAVALANRALNEAAGRSEATGVTETTAQSEVAAQPEATVQTETTTQPEVAVPPEAIASRAFRLCVVRPPSEEEVARLVRLYHAARRGFENDPESARQLLGHLASDASDAKNPSQVDAASTDDAALIDDATKTDDTALTDNLSLAKRAAWVLVANVLISLDETLTRR
jgi:mono/diheme cytochrome c family protein